MASEIKGDHLGVVQRAKDMEYAAELLSRVQVLAAREGVSDGDFITGILAEVYGPDVVRSGGLDPDTEGARKIQTGTILLKHGLSPSSPTN